MQIDSIVIMERIYNESKFWLAFAGSLWTVFRGISWIKAIRTNDLHHIQIGINALQNALANNTTAIVAELKEMRQDFRTFYLPRSKRRTPRRK